MPLLDYRCNKCGFVDEFLIGIHVADANPPIECPKCKEGKMERLFSPRQIGIDFVGKGFYINDYGKHNWKSHMSADEQAKVLAPDANGNYKDPY